MLGLQSRPASGLCKPSPRTSKSQCSNTCARILRAPMRIAAQGNEAEPSSTADEATRRQVTLAAAAAMSGLGQQLLVAQKAEAIGGNPLDYKKELARKRRKIPLEDYSEGPQGLKYYDITMGSGAEAKVGERVAIHFDVKFRNITFMTSRQGIGVTGGNPLGFDVGQPAGMAGSTLPGIDLGVRGMRVGGQRRVLVPPELGYGSRGVGEIPPNATLQIDIELLSIKTSPLGYRTKIIEG
ncbi:hypothetical protein COO60DRAFT_15796 [Scenedesmus sp. NREL 46B-D3]|nr:hypothetical protein COO60DRAFT_15796 [Scenedesmus sp. NREL 46B-D3]